MLKCKAQFWGENGTSFEKELTAENLSELNHIALDIAKENKMRYSLGEIKEIKDDIKRIFK